MPSALTVLQGLLGKHTRRTTRGWYNFCHKRCGDKKFRLGLNFKTGKYRCFNCGRSGEIKELVPGLKGEIAAPPDDRPEPPPPTDLPWRAIRGTGDLRSLEKRAVAYLEARGVPRTHAARLGLGYGIDGPWLGRVIHPYFDSRGELAGWQGRITYDPDEGDNTRKIRFATRRDMPKERPLLQPSGGALYLIERVTQGQPVLVVEGPYDAIHAERAIQAVALFGSNCSTQQAARLLAKRPTAVYIGLDRDKSGPVWNKDAERWEPDPRIRIARTFYARSDVPVYIVEYPADFEGDWGGYEDKTPHPREELLPLLKGARRFKPGGGGGA